jgi:hypothetical protein
MNLVDWIENNKERLLNTKITYSPYGSIKNDYNDSTFIRGIDLLPYREEIKNLDIFKDKEVIFKINNRYIICGNCYIQGKDGWTDEDKKMDWFHKQVHDDTDKLLYFYGLRIYKNVNMFEMIYAVTRPEEEYIKNKTRTKLIDEMLC